MCVIVVKPQGIKLSKAHWEECFNRNGHGAGLTYVEDDKLIVDKGYFKFDDLYKEIVKHEDKEMIVHFRISSAGNIRMENCHPYHIQSQFKHFAFSVSHNGTLPWRSTAELSDTHCFVMDALGPQLDRDPWWLENEGPMWLKGICGTRNKLAIMKWDAKQKQSTIFIINRSEGVEDMGCWFSNHSYRLPQVWSGMGRHWEQHGDDYMLEEERGFMVGFRDDEKDWSKYGFTKNEYGRWVKTKEYKRVTQTKVLPHARSVMQQQQQDQITKGITGTGAGGKEIVVPRDDDVKKEAERIFRMNSKLEHLSKRGKKILRRMANDFGKESLPDEVYYKMSIAELVVDLRNTVRDTSNNILIRSMDDMQLDKYIVDKYVEAGKNPDIIENPTTEVEDGTPSNEPDIEIDVANEAPVGQVEQFPRGGNLPPDMAMHPGD